MSGGQRSKTVGFWSATFLGVGAMVGAGIFALLGEAATMAGSAVYLSFLCGGVIATLSCYSLGKLGARYPAAGGIVEYLVQAFGVGVFSGGMSLVLYVAATISLTLVAKAFGGYAAALALGHNSPLLADILAVSSVIVFTLLNLRGASKVMRVENAIVSAKLVVLAGFAVAGLAVLKPALLVPAGYPATLTIFESIGVTFFAYEGFRVITNAAEDMVDPGRTLPRALFAAVFVVTVLYTLLAVAVFGNLPVHAVIASKDYALAEAAQPVFGHAGFVIVTLVALVSTASAINAGLFAITNVTYELAKAGELPQAFGRPLARSYEGGVISAAVIIALALLLDLSEIAVIGSTTILFVHLVVHVGHALKLRRVTGAALPLLLAAIGSNLAAIGLVLYSVAQRSVLTPIYIGAFVGGCFLTELLLRRIKGRKIVPRISADFLASKSQEQP